MKKTTRKPNPMRLSLSLRVSKVRHIRRVDTVTSAKKCELGNGKAHDECVKLKQT